MLSTFLASPLKNTLPFLPYFPCSPTYPLLLPGPGIPLYWGTFTGPRASPPIDDRLGHPQLHIQLDP